MKLLIINGPNLNLLAQRDTQIYGSESFELYFERLKKSFPKIDFSFFQSNVEGELINELQTAQVDGIIFNAGGYSHTSIAIRDCVEAIKTPVVEVHISNLSARESFRHDSLISSVCVGSIVGFGMKSYDLAAHYFVH